MMSPKPLRGLFQWTDDEEEASRYASSATVSSVQTGRVSANMADNNKSLLGSTGVDLHSSTGSSRQHPTDVEPTLDEPEQQ